MSYLKRGMSGEPVRLLQEKLGVTADGDFGPGTDKALRDYQSKHGLAVDGVAGPDTFTAMGLFELVLLRRGTKGAAVKKLQEALGIGADGAFGPGTEKALKEYQASNGLAADGIAGPRTLAALNVYAEMTDDVVARSRVPADIVVELPEPPAGLPPELSPPPAQADASGLKSIWNTVKGWFS